MADEFQSGVCSGNWWNPSPKNGLNGVEAAPCSTTLNDIGNFGGWSSDQMVNIKANSCEESVSVSDSSMVFQDSQKPQGSDSVSGGGGGGGGGGNTVLMDSTLQMMGFGLSSPMDWNQALVLNRNGGSRGENSFHSILQDELSSRPNYLQENMIESSRNFSGSSGDSSVAYKQVDHQGVSLDQNRLNNSDACTVTCQSLPTSNFSMESVPYGYQTTFFQGLLEPDLQAQPSPYDNRIMNYQSYGANMNDLSHSWQKFPQYQKTTSPPKQQASTNQLQFSNNTPFWNPSAMSTMANVRPTYLPPVQNQFFAQSFEEKPNCSNYSVKAKLNEVRESAPVVKKVSSEPALKRPRVETPSPLPTFKVRKEKLGDRVTALQQLVSPFGKTDTASVLYEAIEYIKFLHEQVSILSAPYMKNGTPIQHHQQSTDKAKKDGEGPQQDLRSRGLCLVPMSSIFPVSNDATADLWTPTFGGTYR